jgi:protein gp37
MPYEGLVRRTPQGPRWTGRVRLVQDQLELPLRWKKPRRIFVNSMSDLFHEALGDHEIAEVFAVMALAPQHQFLILTKRPERMRRWVAGPGPEHARSIAARTQASWGRTYDPPIQPWPFRGVWLGVSVEDQPTAVVRIPELLQVPAAVRWISAEPLLAPLDLRRYLGNPLPRPWPFTVPVNGGHPPRGLDWAVTGGESGHRARECDPAWIRTIVSHCRKAGTPVFTKQMGAAWARTHKDYPFNDAKGADPEEWDPDLRVREMPKETR